uniref:hypothetical protein n=1 Tax=Spirosoma sp. TaxID=1899569 RepID=UPI003B3B6A14
MRSAVILLFLLVSTLTSLAQTFWIGSTSTDWNTPSNWNTNLVPTASSDVVIPKVINSPIIGTGVTALAKSIEVQIGASFTIASGSLTVDGSRIIAGFTTAFSNKGTVNNSGQLVIGSGGASGEYGLRNQGVFINKVGGSLQIDGSALAGLYNGFVASFTNETSLVIGSMTSVGTYGVLNEGSFSNNPGGNIQIDRSIKAGLFNDYGSFTNEASLVIGSVDSAGDNGLLNEGNFINNPSGSIQVDRSIIAGLYNSFTASFINKATVAIGKTATVGEYGLLNLATLLNEGQLQIDHCIQYGFGNQKNTLGLTLDPSVNRGSIVIGSLAPVGAYGYSNQAPFLNSANATLSLFAPF